MAQVTQRNVQQYYEQKINERSVSAPPRQRRHRQAAKQPVATRERIEHLSQPKQPRTIWIRTLGIDGEEYVWKRVFWGDQESLWPLSRAALSANATPRVAELSAPKRNFQESKNNAEFLYSCGRESVIWKVPPGATNAEPTPRIQDLAKPKNVNAGFLEDRPQRQVKYKPRQSATAQSRPETRQGGQRSGRTSYNSSPSQKPLPPVAEGL